MIGLKTWLTLAAASYSTAFVPTSLRDTRSLPPLAVSLNPLNVFKRVEKKLEKTEDWVKDSIKRVLPSIGSSHPEVFSGVHLPKGCIPPPVEDKASSKRVEEFGLHALPKVLGLIGKPKSDGLEPLQKVYIDVTLSDYTKPEKTFYQYFGENGQNSKILATLLKVDTFFASALTKSKDGFELRSFDPEDPGCTNNPSLYRQIVSSLEGCGRRVNFFFDEKMEVTGYEVFDEVKGKLIPYGEAEIEYFAGAALYNTLFYASSVHATIHILHYLMTSAFQFVSEDFEPMHEWAKYYATNIQKKYAQVDTLLIKPPPDHLNIQSVLRMTALITGRLGFGASNEKITPVLVQLLNTWGENPSADAWFQSMMNISTEDMDKAGILTEFRKHFDLVEPFSKDVSNVFKEIDANKSKSTERDLVEYLKKCGSFSSNVDSLEDWIQLMCVTGEMHGSTLGYTRLAAMWEVMQWRDIQRENWDFVGTFMNFLLIATITGMEDGNHVMTSTYPGRYNSDLQVVLDKYDKATTDLKKEYEAKIQEDPDFEDYGWILTEFCTDGFDGKQLTTATYI